MNEFERISRNDEIRVNAVFPYNNWMAVFLAKDPFVPGSQCQHQGDGNGCPQTATSRILVNIWGTIAEYEVCDDHASFHGKLLDDFPARTR